MFFFVHAPGCCAPFFPPIHPSIHPPPPSPLTSSSPMAGFVTSLLPPLPSPFVFGPVRRFVLIILNPAPRASNFRPPPVRVSRRHGGRKGGKRKKGGMEECGEIREVFEEEEMAKTNLSIPPDRYLYTSLSPPPPSSSSPKGFKDRYK